MPGFGFGFGSRKYRQIAIDGGLVAVSELLPSATWNGSPGTGFSSIPSDPARITAKPAVRLLTPPRQRYTDSYAIGVTAGANDNGSLIQTLGIEKVVFHYEGTALEVLAPSFRTFDDANSNPVTYLGWWTELKHNGTNGEARLYVEAVPRDSTMQRRIIGPYNFFPEGALYDTELEIAPSQPVIAGQRYKTIGGAGFYCRGQGIKFPRFTFTESGEHLFDPVNFGYYHTGVFTVEAAVPVTLTLDSTAFETGVGNAFFNPGTNSFHFKGDNITIDFAYANEWYTAGPQPIYIWLDGINVINSAGNYSLWRKKPRNNIVWLMRGGGSWLTECYFEALWQAGIDARLVRGNTLNKCWSDIFNLSDCIVENLVYDHDNSAYRADVDALTVSYSGTEATATIAISTANLVTLTWGANSDSWQISATPGAANYSVQNLADWIATHADFTTSVLDDTRAAYGLGLPTQLGGPFAAQGVKSAPLTLTTAFDIHADWYQKQDAGSNFTENVVIYGNRGYNNNFQGFFIGGVPGMKDAIILNNAFHNEEPVGDYSQFGQNESHVVVAHNTWATQGIFLGSNLAGDGYTLFANNIAWRMYHLTDAPDGDIVYANNLVQSSFSETRDAADVIGGDASSLFGGAHVGDFVPAGALLANQKPSIVPYDLNRNARGAFAPAGAVGA